MKRSIFVIAALAFTSSFSGVQGAEPVLVGTGFAISSVGQEQTLSAVAHASARNRYLVAWADKRNATTTGADIFGQLVKANGTLFGRAIPISKATGEQTRPAVASSTVDDSFLVIFPSDGDIFGRIVGSNGRPIGPSFPISTAFGVQNRPNLTYDTVNNRYLAVWEDGRNSDKDVFGQVILSDGTLLGENILISGAGGDGDQERTDVEYNPLTQQYLVVWTDFRNHAVSGTDILAQFVDPSGTLVGGSFLISAEPGDQFRPHLAFDTADDRFLIAWTDCRNDVSTCTEKERHGTDVFAQLVSGGGALIGSSIPIATDPAPSYRSAVAFSTADGAFLVVWADERDQQDLDVEVFVQAVNIDGTLAGGNTSVTGAETGQLRPVVAYNPLDGNFLISYTNQCCNLGDIYGQFVTIE